MGDRYHFRGINPDGGGFSPIWQAIRRAIESYEGAVLTTDAADSLASDVVAVMEEDH